MADEVEQRFDPRPVWVRAAEAFALAQTKGRTSEQQRTLDDWRIRTALEVVGDLRARMRPQAPERPLSFPANDDALRSALRRAQGARHPSAEERTLLNEAGAWRLMRWRVEHEGSARIMDCFEALRSIDAVLKTHPNDTVLTGARVALVEFLRDEWGIEISEVPSYFAGRELADASSRLPATRADATRADVPQSSGREEW